MFKANTLVCKLVAKKAPTSNAFICLRIQASFQNAKKALYVKDLHSKITLAQVNALCAQLAAQQRCANFSLLASPSVLKKLHVAA